jgi:tetratricopeptide (TPR) repeat protein
MKIMTALQVELTEGEYASGITDGTSNLQANEYWWRAEKHFFRYTKEDNAQAREWVEKAIELDPKFAAAWALLGWTHFENARNAWGNSPAQSIKRAGECAQKAIALNDSSAKAYGLMGFISKFTGMFDEAVEYSEKAVAINPNDPHMLALLASILDYTGKFDESIVLVKKAMRLSPYYPALYLAVLYRPYFLTGRYEEALAVGKLLLERSRKGEINPLYAHLILAQAYIRLDQKGEARAQVEEMLKIDPNFSLERWQKWLSYKDPAHLERHIAALREAGLK